MHVFLKLPKGRAIRLWRTRRDISNRLLFTLANWETSLLLVGPGRLVRWY